MATLINIETSTEICSVALSVDGKSVWHKENYDGMSHSVSLAKFIEEMMAFAKGEGLKADGVAVSCGPGSYTGLRIGVSTSKGLCYGLDVPLISVNTLEVMANHVLKSVEVAEETLLCPMIDARRMEVYTAFFDKNLAQKRATSADIIDGNSYLDIKERVLFFGNGAAKCQSALNRGNFQLVENVVPLATDMVELSHAAFERKQFQDVAYFEPFYLKEFVATVAKNKVIAAN